MHSCTLNPQPSAREIAHGRLAKTLAEEGMVLLKNDGLLPLAVPVSPYPANHRELYTVAAREEWGFME